MLFLDHLSNYQSRGGFAGIISDLKKPSYGRADGANWVIAALRKESGSFPPASTSFEVSVATLGRRYDAVIDNAVIINGTPKKRYVEFKSYKSVPPSDFSDQFIKDLNNTDIADLSQIKWYFDVAKNPANFETNMKAAIDGLDLSNQTSVFFSKYGVVDDIGLKIKLKTEFSSIFILK